MPDIALDTPAARPCTRASRRDFLRVGSLGLAGLSLPTWVRAEAGGSAGRPRAKSAILVFLGGGLSHLDTFDPKPDAPAEIRGPFDTIGTAVPGLRVSDRLPLLARVMDKVALVRSGTHTSDHHETAANWVLSGRFGTAFGDYPALGAVVAHETGFAGPLPPHVAVPRNPAFTWELGKSAFLGGRFESFKAGDPNRANVRELSPAARAAFAIDREPEKLRDRYGRTTAGQSLLLARRLVESGVRFVTVSSAGWDHHAGIFENLDKKLPEFDRGLSALIEDLHDRGTFEDTLLVVMGEFGRTPTINPAAGRDHWGQAGSLLFAGAGVKPGLVLGKTDGYGAYVTERPVSPADVAYTILDSLGIDPHKHLPTPDGRPVEILDQGACVTELFA